MQDNSIDIRQKFILNIVSKKLQFLINIIIMFHSVNSFINSMKISSENLRPKKWDKLKIMNSFEIEGCVYSIRI